MQWSDDMWMEWQAVNVAPRILMPVQSLGDKFQGLLVESKSNSLVRNGVVSQMKWIKSRLAEFYEVSKQSVEIRLKELECT
jgi:Zn-dependent peptidase ImmA (M78 family)